MNVARATSRPDLPSVLSVRGPATLRGRIRMPGDKSISHRCLMLSALAAGTSTISGLSTGADVQHTLRAIQLLGAQVDGDRDGKVRITGGPLTASTEVIDVGNSGTGIRLLAGMVAAAPFRTVLDGDASIRRRPMDRVTEPLRAMGARIGGPSDGTFPPLTIDGTTLTGIHYDSPVPSAQVKSAILLAGLSAVGPTTVVEPLVSRRHTEEMLAARGARITVDGTTTRLEPSALAPLDDTVPGDPSQAAFWLTMAAAIPGSDVTVDGVYVGPARDGFLDVLRRMGADVVQAPGKPSGFNLRVAGGSLRATEIAPAEIPSLVDEIPVLAVAAALAEGTTVIRGAGELRLKESDRLATVADMLHRFGADVTETDDGLRITGGRPLRPTTVDSHGDHRIAMAGALAALTCSGVSIINGFDMVATSYPSFLDDLEICAPECTIS